MSAHQAAGIVQDGHWIVASNVITVAPHNGASQNCLIPATNGSDVRYKRRTRTDRVAMYWNFSCPGTNQITLREEILMRVEAKLPKTAAILITNSVLVVIVVIVTHY